MKEFTPERNMVIQGDVCLTRVNTIPENCQVVPPEGNRVVVTHSETGHHHAFETTDDVVMYEDPSDELMGFLEVKKSADLKHYRPNDTHETIRFTPGVYRINRQREYLPEGMRRVQD